LDLGVSGFSDGAGSGVTGGRSPGFGMGAGGTTGALGAGMGVGGTAGWSGTGIGTGGTAGGTTGGVSGAGTGGTGGRGFSSPGAGTGGGLSGDCAIALKGKARTAKARWMDFFIEGKGAGMSQTKGEPQDLPWGLTLPFSLGGADRPAAAHASRSTVSREMSVLKKVLPRSRKLPKRGVPDDHLPQMGTTR